MTNGPSLLTASPVKQPRERDMSRTSLKKPKLPRQHDKRPGRAQSVRDETPERAEKAREPSPALTSDDDGHYGGIDEDKFNRVIESNIKAIPKRRIPLHSRSAKGAAGRKRSGSTARKQPTPEKLSAASKAEEANKELDKEEKTSDQPVEEDPAQKA